MGDIDTRQIVADNLKAWMKYAKENGRLDLASVKALARVSGVQRFTIDGILNAERNTGVQTLQKIAEAFETQAWVLLTPRAKLENLPVRPVTQTEIGLYKRMIDVQREYAKWLREQGYDPESPGGAAGPDTETPRSSGNGAGKRNPGDD